MQLINVLSAEITRWLNIYSLVIVADLGKGDGAQQYPFTYHVDDNDGLTPDVQAWLMEHPEFPLPEYVPPAPLGPEAYPLTARQMRLGLVRGGVSLKAIQTAIDNLPNPARDEAQIYWEFSTIVKWGDATMQSILAAAGLDTESATAMWLAAKDYEA